MGQHGEYGTLVIKRATDGKAVFYGPTVEVPYGRTAPARIDATFDDQIAIEVEARVPKQVRGAILDLICHPFPKKLLIIVPAHTGNADQIRSMSFNIFSRFLANGSFEVCILKGTGSQGDIENDAGLVSSALTRLRAMPQVQPLTR